MITDYTFTNTGAWVGGIIGSGYGMRPISEAWSYKKIAIGIVGGVLIGLCLGYGADAAFSAEGWTGN